VVNISHAEAAKTLEKAFVEAQLISPGSSGVFGNLVFSHDLVHRIGGGADSNANLTRRMLMLLESRPFDGSSHVWDNVVGNILERYFEEDVHFSPMGERTVPRFLLNDLTRYWRTICVDYAAKHRDQGDKKWAMRNAKLRLSRKLIFAAGLAFCLSCQLDAPNDHQIDLFSGSWRRDKQPFIQAAKMFAQTPPLEYIAKFVCAFVPDEKKRLRVANLVFGAYNEWLMLISDADARRGLEGLSHANASNDVVFNKVREIGKAFADGLRLLFFNRENDSDPIANLSLDYVGF